MINIQISTQGIDSLLTQIRNATSEASQRIQERMVESARENIVVVAKALVPKKTGALAESIDVLPGESPISIEIVATQPYAAFLEYGTRSYLIEPRNGRALRYEEGSVVVFAKRVRHPGIPRGKFSFIGPAIAEGIQQFYEDLHNFFRETMMMMVLSSGR